MMNENDDIAIGPEDQGHYDDGAAGQAEKARDDAEAAKPGNGSLKPADVVDPNPPHDPKDGWVDLHKEKSGVTISENKLGPTTDLTTGEDTPAEGITDAPTNASRNPELVPASENPNDPSVSKGTINIVSLLMDNYGMSMTRAREMCRFGTISIDGEAWESKKDFNVPYEKIAGKEISVIEEGQGGVKFTYGG